MGAWSGVPLDDTNLKRMKLYSKMSTLDPTQRSLYGSPQAVKEAMPGIQSNALQFVRGLSDQEINKPPIRVRGGGGAPASAPAAAPVIGQMRHGGTIPRTGNYKMHAGEHVIPAGGRHMAKERWMQSVKKGMKRRGTEGVFSSAAHRAGKSTSEFAREHEHSKGKIGQRARLALAFAKGRQHRG